MNKIIKRIILTVTALAVTLSVAVIFDIPEKISAAAEGVHSHKACADSSHENCTHSEVEYEPFPTTPDDFKVDLKYIIIEEDKNYYLTDDSINGTFKDYQICIKDATVNFCLNGHTLEVKCIRVSGSGELNVCDCGTGGCFTAAHENTGGILETRTGGTLNIYSGKIQVNDVGIAINCGCHDDNGSDITNIYGGEINGTIMVGNEKTLSIYGGTVKHDSENPDASHTGISVLNNATVNINGGSIFGGKYGIVAVYSDSTVNINGGSVESKDKYAVWIQNRTVCNINSGTVTNASTDSCAIYTLDDGVVNINGGEVVGKNYGAVYCGNNGKVRISDGVVSTESTEFTCIYNNKGTLTVSGGKVFGEKYGIRNYNSGATTTISGGTVSCKGTGVYNYSDGVFEINGGEIISESGTGISNKSTLNVSGGKVSGGTYGILNSGGDAVTAISKGDVSSKGNICINNYNSGALNITGGRVSGGEYCIYNSEGTTTISGGTVSARGSYALYNEEKGTAVINGGTLNSTFSPITNLGTVNISGGSFGAENPATITYMINQKNMNLSGSPVFRNSPIWLQTDDNIGITGELGLSEPCAVYINSAVPRIFTNGWSTNMQGQKTSDYFKSPYSSCTVDTDSSGEALLRNLIVTFDANGGVCGTPAAYVNSDGKISPLPEATKEKYTFDGWFTEKTGGEKITTDTVFTDDTTIYAHWMCDHSWGDTYEKDEDQHWKVCTKCGAESEKSNHTWDNGKETTPPTETTEGVKTYKCTVCNAEKTEKLEKLPHTHTYSDDWTSDDNGHWHAATCGHDVKSGEAEHDFGAPTVTPSTCTQHGSEEYICRTCGYKKTVTLDLAEHNFDGEWQKDENNHWKVCTVCSTEKSEVTAHSWNDGEITKQPTEDEAGVMLYTCTVCKATKTEPIAPLDHTHDWSGEWSKDDTYHWHDCLNNCGEKKDNAAHIWDDGTVTKQPTADAEGEKTFECTVCGKTKTETLPPKDEPSDPDSGNISVDVQPGENAPDTELKTPFEELVNAVLTAEEQEKIKNGIDIKIILIVSDATASVPTDDKTKIEAAIRGLSGYKLGQYLDVTMLKKIGEIEQAITNTNAPIRITFEIPTALRGKSEYSVIRVHGSETTILKDLDSDPNTVTIETNKFSTYALTYKEKTSGGGSGGSGGGGSSHHHRYIYDETIIKEPTCTESGEKTLSCSCGQTTTETVPALGHDYRSEITKPATETEDGVKTFTCTRCGDTYTEIIPKTGSESKPSDTSSDTSDNTSSETSDDTSSGVSTSDDTSSGSGDTPSDNSGSSSGGDSSPSGGDNPSTGIAVSLIPLAAILSGVIIISNRRKK